MVNWQGLLNTNYWVKCYQRVKVSCELLHCTNMLILGWGGKGLELLPDCLKKDSTVKVIALFCKYFRQGHCYPEIQLLRLFVLMKMGGENTLKFQTSSISSMIIK